MPVADLVVLVCLAAVLGLSGTTKVKAKEETADAFVSLRVPAFIPARPAAAALPWVELVLAIGLLASPPGLLWVVAIATTLLLTAYTVLIARALQFDEPVNCSCFGRLGGHRIDRLTLIRNLVLTGLGVWAIVIAAGEGSAPAAIAGLTTEGWVTLAAVVASATAVVLIVVGSREQSQSTQSSNELDYQRVPIPFATLKFLNGNIHSLRDVVLTQARLLIFLTSGCGACVRVGAMVDDWQSRLTPAVGILVVYAEGTTKFHEHSHDLVALDPEGNTAVMLNVYGGPHAVLLGADGLLAGGPVTGKSEVTRFVEDIIRELESGDAEIEPAADEAPRIGS